MQFSACSEGVNIPVNSPSAFCYVETEVETVSKKGLCKWHNFTQLNPCSGTVLLANFFLESYYFI